MPYKPHISIQNMRDQYFVLIILGLALACRWGYSTALPQPAQRSESVAIAAQESTAPLPGSSAAAASSSVSR